MQIYRETVADGRVVYRLPQGSCAGALPGTHTGQCTVSDHSMVSPPGAHMNAEVS